MLKRKLNRRWRHVGAVACIVLASAIAVPSSGAAAESSSLGPVVSTAALPNGAYQQLQARVSGLCLDVSWEYRHDGAQLAQYHCLSEQRNQRFNVTSTGYPYNYGIIWALHSGKVLDDAGSTTAGTRIHQWGYHGGHEQQWAFINQGDGWFLIQNRHSGLCMDIQWGSAAPGAPLIQWPCHGGWAQQFKFRS